ncbi:MAG: hypothetical protein D4Q79_01410 [Spirochaetia bacterium]|nr:MAG: hypothetical protein D4Q79_01410 [Spirochaetia bacterium]
MDRLFKLELIQPDFDKLYEEYRNKFASAEKEKKESIGILNEGENTSIIDNIFEGLDIGIKDKGKNTITADNKFIGKLATINKESFLSKFFWYFIVGIAVVVIGGLILKFIYN